MSRWRDGIDLERLDDWITGHGGQDQFDNERDPEQDGDGPATDEWQDEDGDKPVIVRIAE